MYCTEHKNIIYCCSCKAFSIFVSLIKKIVALPLIKCVHKCITISNFIHHWTSSDGGEFNVK